MKIKTDAINEIAQLDLPSRQALWHESKFKIGNTDCYNIGARGDRNVHVLQDVSRLAETCHPHFVRIIGSVPSEKVHARVEKACLDALSRHPVGMVLAACTHTTATSDPGRHIASIPEIALKLQSRSYSSSLYGTIGQVLGTVPVNAKSFVQNDELMVRDSKLRVTMHPHLKQSLIIPGDEDYSWYQEALGVVDTAEKILTDIPGSIYTVFLIGGGPATAMEYHETINQLSSRFHERVNIVLLENTEGFTDQTLKRSLPKNVYQARATSVDLLQALTRAKAEAGFQMQSNPEASKSTRSALVHMVSARMPSLGFSPAEFDSLAMLRSQSERKNWTTGLLTTVVPTTAGNVEELVDLVDFGKSLGEPLTRTEYEQRKEVFEGKYKRLTQFVAARLSNGAEFENDVEKSTFLFTFGVLLRIRNTVDRMPRKVVVDSLEELQAGDLLKSQAATTMFLEREGGRAKCICFEGAGSKEVAIEVSFPTIVEQQSMLLPTAIEQAGETTVQVGSIVRQDQSWAVVTRCEGGHVDVVLGEATSDERLYVRDMRIAELIRGDANVVTPAALAVAGDVGPLTHIDEVLSAASAVNELPEGTIFSSQGHRFVVVDNETTGERGILCQFGGNSLAFPPEAFIAAEIKVEGSLSDQRFLENKLKQFAETTKSWEGMEHGGFINYLDGDSKLIARDELLSLRQAYSKDDQELPPSCWRHVTVLRTDLRSGNVRVVSRNWEVTELSLPPAWLPEAMKIEVFGAEESHHAEAGALSNNRVIASAFASFREAAERMQMSLREAAITAGIEDTLKRVWSIQNGEDKSELEYLRSLDPEFENILTRQGEYYRDLKRFNSLSRAWSGLLVQRAPEIALQLTRFDELLGETSAEFQQDFVARLEDLKADISDPELKRVTQEFLTAIRSLMSVFDTRAQSPSVSQPYSMHLYSSDNVPTAILEQSAEIMKSHEAPPGDAHAFLSKRGGITTEAFSSVEGLRRYLSKGSKLLVIVKNHESKEVVTHVAGFTGPQNISTEKKQLLPVLTDNGAAIYDIACMAQHHSDFLAGPIALLRAATLALVHEGAESIYWEIDADNSASTQIGFAENHYVVVEHAYARTLKGETDERQFNIWGVPTDPEQRRLLSLSPQSSKGRREIIQNMKRAHGGFMTPTPAELDQMRTVQTANQDSPFTRWSIGVASMTEAGQNRLLELIHERVFKGLSGVHTWTPTYNVKSYKDMYHIVEEDGGAHKFFTQLTGELSADAFPVGYLVKDVHDTNYGRVVDVVLPAGETASMPVISTSTHAENLLAVGDLTQFRSIQGTYRMPQKIEPQDKGVNKWSATAARSACFGDLFDDQMYVFAAGGRVVGWEIGHTVFDILDKNRTDKRILLLSSLGGSVDRLVEDPIVALRSFYPAIEGILEWEKQTQELFNSGVITVIDVNTQSHLLRDYFKQQGRSIS